MSTQQPTIAKQRQRKLAKQIANSKWWKQPYDHRPNMEGDLISVRESGNKKRIFIKDPESFSQAIGHTISDRNIEVQTSYRAVIERGNRYRFASTVHLIIDQDTTVPVSADIINSHMSGLLYGLGGKTRVIQRAEPVHSDMTNAEAFLRLLENVDERWQHQYDYLLARFQERDISLDSLDEINGYAPYVQWQQDSQDVSNHYSFNANSAWAHLTYWAEELEEMGLDPETGRYQWANQSLHDEAGYSIIKIDEDEIVRHGNMTGHCIRNIDDQPYLAMQGAGHWQLYALVDEQGKGVATVCVVSGEDEWIILENRTRANAPLDPESREGEGKPAKYGRIIDNWIASLPVNVNREDENKRYAPEHPEHGLRAYGYQPQFYGELWEYQDPAEWDLYEAEWTGREGHVAPNSISRVVDYLTLLENYPHEFWDSDPEPDYQERIREYSPGNSIDFSLEAVNKVVDDLISIPPAKRNIEAIRRCLTGIYLLCQHEDDIHGLDGASDKYDAVEAKLALTRSSNQLGGELGLMETEDRAWAQVLEREWRVLRAIRIKPLPSNLNNANSYPTDYLTGVKPELVPVKEPTLFYPLLENDRPHVREQMRENENGERDRAWTRYSTGSELESWVNLDGQELTDPDLGLS
jgi:hypothetical protein